MPSIKYLHFSDLHIGDKFQSGLISQMKKVLFEDIEYILSKLETLDVVFFTGDFVQMGTKDEFLLLENFLIEMWSLFNKYQQNPILFCVPGNHDLVRHQDNNDPVQKIMSNWTNEESIREEYFWTSPNVYHNFVKDRFENYSNWYNNTSIPKPEIHVGYLPGDFHSSINLNGLKLGVVGLNSTFLQLHGGDVKGKLGVYNKQISAMFKENYFEWLGKNDFSILLTHHSPEWFEPDSANDFNQEIYTKNNYVELLCGHMHEPSYTNTSINGFSSKRIFVSPSLFGIEKYDNKISRIHGYTAGIYSIDSEKIIKTIWPRISLQTKSGLKISQNEEFNFEKGSFSLTEVLTDFQLRKSKVLEEKKIENINKETGNLFSKNNLPDKNLPRTNYKKALSHTVIRIPEKNMCINQLNTKKISWILTTFGLGEVEFIGSIIDEADINHENCFSISCEKAQNIEELIELFKSTFAKNITQFFEIINSIPKPLLVISNLTVSVIEDELGFKEFLQTIYDFCPELKTIILTEVIPENQSIEYIELTALDIPAVKLYVEISQEIQVDFTFLEYEKIHRISSGIPHYIDKIIEQLKFRPFSDLGDMEFDILGNDHDNTILPKSLKNEIQLLSADDSKQGHRKFVLLCVLSLLHNGETYERIRRYDSTLPFYSDDITYLLNNKLVETVQVNSIFAKEKLDSELVKVIRVPRLIRDYISSLLSTSNKVDIYKKVCDIYLGNNWRTSIKLVQPKDAELDLIVHQNLQIAIRFILLNGVEQKNEVETNRMTSISLDLIKYFSNRGAYKEATFLSEETLLLIKDVEFTNIESVRTQLMKRLGENLRMTSTHDRAIPILKSICDDYSNSLSNNERNYIRLDLAYGYKSQKNKIEATPYAELAKSNEKSKDTSVYLSAESILVSLIEDKSEKMRKLNAIKNKAEKLGHTTLKTNLILELTDETTDKNQLKQIDKIIQTSNNDNTYNKVRALVAKAKIVLNTKKTDEISENDLLGLNLSYSYSFYQRLETLLTRCHKLAWEFWYKQSRYDKLLNLFRYSSFVWRLCGEIKLEKQYIDLLYENKDFMNWFKSNRIGINSSYFEQRLFASLNDIKAPKELKQ